MKPKNSKPKSWRYAFKVDVRNEADSEHAEMVISGPIGYSWWDNSGTSSKVFRDKLATIPKDRDVKVRINSEGGSIQDGLEIYNVLKERGNVTTVNDGYCLSCASLIALAGATVISPKSSIWMIHTPRIETYGDAAEHQKAVDMLKKHQDMMADVYSAEMGVTKAEAHAIMEAETWYTGSEAVDEGLADFAEEPDEDDAEMEASRLVRVVAKHNFNPPEHIRELISARSASGKNQTAEPAASVNPQSEPVPAVVTGTNVMPTTQTPPVAAPAAPANSLEARFLQERKMRISGEVNRRAQGKIKNDQLDWWIAQAMDAQTVEAEQAVYAQLESLPVAAAPGTEPVRPDAQAEAAEDRPPVFEITPATGCNPRANKRLPWMAEIRKTASAAVRMAALKKDWAGRLNYTMELDARDNRGNVVASNTYSSTLITDFLVDAAVTILMDRWAALACFSIEFGPDRYKEYATAQVKYVTASGSTLKGTKSSPITNFEQGDGTVVPISVPMTHYVKSFNVSQEDLMAGLRIENLMKRNLGQLASDVTVDALTPIMGQGTGTQIPGPLNSSGNVVSFSAGTTHILASTFGWNAGQTTGAELATLWAYLKKSPEKNLILDGNLYGRLTNSPGYFQQPMGEEERSGAHLKTFGWNLIEENTAWPGVVDSGGNTLAGFVCAPQAIVGVTGLPQTPPNIPGAVLQETVVTLPGPDISISMFTWFSLQARKLWNSFELMGGFAGGDATAGGIIFNGRGSVS